MPASKRPATLVLLLLLAIFPIVGTVAEAGACTDECGFACGDCVICGIACLTTAPARIAPPPALGTLLLASFERPSPIAARAIDHVPWLAA